MKVTFLGTGTSQGVPFIGCEEPVCLSIDFRDKRLRSSIMIEVDGQNIVVDTGPDFRQQMLREHVKKLDAVLFTHHHKDHVAGLDDIRPFYFRQKNDIPVFANQEVIKHLKMEYSYMFAENKYPGIASVNIKEISAEEEFYVGETKVTPIEVMHYKLPVLGFRIKDFTYITDAKTISEKEMEKIKGTKVLVLNALQPQSHISHLTLDEALAIVEQIQPEKAFFTHISYRMGFHEEMCKSLPEHINLAYDGLKLKI
ncbi:MBL fold metallo-hydrolase [Flammeovirgaceae bacterium SG7u.111]|nr:MBL fold metallo-hydrolase [Flammeovirgaceae bacterium SG7u.132]WPO34243.1 MBL fold metallo-hydrolase [Flammeovirgaceae bacterium SG7u.111]